MFAIVVLAASWAVAFPLQGLLAGERAGTVARFRVYTGLAFVAALSSACVYGRNGPSFLGTIVVGYAVWYAVVLAYWRWRGVLSGASEALAAPPAPNDGTGIADSVLAVVSGTALFAAFVAALAPVTDSMSITSVLWPARIAWDTAAQPASSTLDTVPALRGLAAFAFAFEGERGVAVVHWSFALLTVLGLLDLGQALGVPRAGALAAALWATAPVTIAQANAPGAIWPASAFLVAAFSAAVHARRARHPNVWTTVAVLCASAASGFAAPSVFAIPIVLAVALWRHPLGTRGIGASLLGAAILGTWFVPWADIGTGLGALWSERYADTNPLGYLRFVWDLAMRPGEFDGWAYSPGPLPIALGIAGLIYARSWALLGIAAMGLALVYAHTRDASHALPFLLPLFVGAGLAATQPSPYRTLARALCAVVLVTGCVLHGAALYPKVPVAGGFEAREPYYTDRIANYHVVAYANAFLTDGPILVVGWNGYLFDSKTIGFLPDEWQGYASLGNRRQVVQLQARGVVYVLLPESELARVEGDDTAGLPAPLRAMLRSWQQDTKRFEHVRTMPIVLADGTPDRVGIYRVRRG